MIKRIVTIQPYAIIHLVKEMKSRKTDVWASPDGRHLVNSRGVEHTRASLERELTFAGIFLDVAELVTELRPEHFTAFEHRGRRSHGRLEKRSPRLPRMAFTGD